MNICWVFTGATLLRPVVGIFHGCAGFTQAQLYMYLARDVRLTWAPLNPIAFPVGSTCPLRAKSDLNIIIIIIISPHEDLSEYE